MKVSQEKNTVLGSLRYLKYQSRKNLKTLTEMTITG